MCAVGDSMFNSSFMIVWKVCSIGKPSPGRDLMAWEMKSGGSHRLFLFVPVLLFHKPGFLGADHRTAGHAEVVQAAGHDGFHESHFAHDSLAADGAHHVAGAFELLDELADFLDGTPAPAETRRRRLCSSRSGFLRSSRVMES